jgi:3',5'-cyclic AMP phosphodiesterase CpdA
MSFLLAQITDTHVVAPDHRGELYVDNNARLQLAVERLLAETVTPDAVLVTGDLTDLGTDEEMAIVTELLSPLTMPVFVVPGNHDLRSSIRTAFDMPWAADDNMSWVVDTDPITIVGLDTLAADQIDDEGAVRHGGELDDTRARWLDQALAAAAGRPTVIAMHHPPFTTGIGWMDETGLDDGSRFADIVSAHSHVTRIFCGHLHRPITTTIAGVLCSTGLSTIHQVELNLSPEARPQVVCDPPGYQLHVFDGGRWVTHTRHFDTGRAVIDPGWA